MRHAMKGYGMPQESTVAGDRYRVASSHPHGRLLEMPQQEIERAVLDYQIGAHHDQHGTLCLADEKIDGRRLAFAAFLLDEAHAWFAAGYVGHDVGRPVLAAAGHYDDFPDLLPGQFLSEDAVEGVGDIGFLVVGHYADAAFRFGQKLGLRLRLIFVSGRPGYPGRRAAAIGTRRRYPLFTHVASFWVETALDRTQLRDHMPGCFQPGSGPVYDSSAVWAGGTLTKSRPSRLMVLRAIWRTLCSTFPPRSARSSMALPCAWTRNAGVSAGVSPRRFRIPAKSWYICLAPDTILPPATPFSSFSLSFPPHSRRS